MLDLTLEDTIACICLVGLLTNVNGVAVRQVFPEERALFVVVFLDGGHQLRLGEDSNEHCPVQTSTRKEYSWKSYQNLTIELTKPNKALCLDLVP